MLLLWAGAADAMKLDKALEIALQDPALIGASYGVRVADGDGRVRFAYDADRRLVPASVAKWITAAAAARDLGLDHTFHTGLAATGWTEGTTLVGDLVIVGGGDPSLGDPDPRLVLDQIVSLVGSAGVEKITGRVVVDPSSTSGPPLGPGWMWDDLNLPYSAPYGAANFAHNVLGPGLDCEAPAGRGSPLRDPAACLAGSVRDALVDAGIAVKGPAVVEAAPEAIEFAALESAPLRELMREMLVTSDNLYAECIRRALDRVRPAEADVAEERIADLLREAGVTDGVRVVDGSGLSRYSMLSADALVRVSDWVARQPWGSELIELLPVAGRDGTLQTRLVGTAAEGHLRAKTGSMSGVRNLVGYVENADGERVVFAVLINGFVVPQAQAIALQDRLILLIAASDRRGRIPRRTVEALTATEG